MELRHLRYFVAVAEALSYRKASERLRVAQPALSKQIRDMESSIGAKLLNRNTRGVSLTDAGAVFLDEVRDILERVDMAAAAARDVGTGQSGRLIIASLGAITANILPDALSVFHTRYAKVDVNIRDLDMGEQLNALKAGTVQVGFFLHSQGAVLPNFCDSLLIQESIVEAALCSQHRLAESADVSLSELMDEQFLCATTPGQDLHRKRTLDILTARNVAHRPVKLVGSYESLTTLIAGNHGVALLMPRPARFPNRIVYKPIREHGEDLRVRMSVIWRKGGASQLAQNFVQILREQLAEPEKNL